MNLAEVRVGLLGDFLPTGAAEIDFDEVSVDGDVLLTICVVLTGTEAGDGGASSLVGGNDTGWGNSSSSVRFSAGFGVEGGGRETIAAVNAMLWDDEVNAAVHDDGKCNVSSAGFEIGGITE